MQTAGIVVAQNGSHDFLVKVGWYQVIRSCQGFSAWRMRCGIGGPGLVTGVFGASAFLAGFLRQGSEDRRIRHLTYDLSSMATPIWASRWRRATVLEAWYRGSSRWVAATGASVTCPPSRSPMARMACPPRARRQGSASPAGRSVSTCRRLVLQRPRMRRAWAASKSAGSAWGRSTDVRIRAAQRAHPGRPYGLARSASTRARPRGRRAAYRLAYGSQVGDLEGQRYRARQEVGVSRKRARAGRVHDVPRQRVEELLGTCQPLEQG